ncbi:MAG: type I phosphomannose isomerase catalytic subunit [Planctomycetota bacterium]
MRSTSLAPEVEAAVRAAELYPLRFTEILKEKVWGGSRMRTFLGKDLPKGVRIGESWEVSCRENDVSQVREGPLAGLTLRDVIRSRPREVLGDRVVPKYDTRFPILLKVIDAQDILSLQVHPPDDYAQRSEPEGYGKVEAWHILHAEPRSKVVRGLLPGTTQTEFISLLSSNRVNDCLNWVEVKAGDTVFLPPGTLHALGKGILACEVQQNSDVTYRVHDWGRLDLDGRPRATHLGRAMQVIDFHSMGRTKCRPIVLDLYGYRREILVKCEKFCIELLDWTGRITETENRSHFHVLFVVSGSGEMYHGPEMKQRAHFQKGHSFLMPAYLGDYQLVASGGARVLKAYPQY